MTATIGLPSRMRRRVSRFVDGRPWLHLGALLSGPVLWIVVLYFGSLIALFVTSFYRLNDDATAITEQFGTANYHELLNATVYRDIALRTIGVAALVTIIDVCLALPIAFFIAKIAKP
ncbi:MAG: ABC transporter permease, partial [Actinobacteria bacterium]|nr:ABC transporter permease [Actinomycetota bacterium]